MIFSAGPLDAEHLFVLIYPKGSSLKKSRLTVTFSLLQIEVIFLSVCRRNSVYLSHNCAQYRHAFELSLLFFQACVVGKTKNFIGLFQVSYNLYPNVFYCVHDVL